MNAFACGLGGYDIRDHFQDSFDNPVWPLMDQSAEMLIKEAFAQDVGVILASPMRMGLFGAARDNMKQGLSAFQGERLLALEAPFAN
jgi:hypothetical protein